MGYRRINLMATAVAASVAAVFAPLSAARTAADFFVSAPDEAVILLEPNTRMDMLDYFNSGLQTMSNNKAGGTARILADDENRLEVLVGRDSNIKIAVIPSKNDTVLAVIETVLTPVADSHVRFYNRDWEPLKYSIPAMPGVMDFVAPADRRKAASAEMPDVCFAVADYDPATQTFTMTNTSQGYYSDRDEPEGLTLMRPSIEMKFDGRRFSEVKSNSAK